MDTDEAFLPPPPVPPKLQMDADSSSLPPPPAPPTLMEVGGTDEEERSGSPEPKTLIDLDAIAEAKARARRLRKPHMTKIKQEPALHGKQAPPKQGPVTENVRHRIPAFLYLAKPRIKAKPVIPGTHRRPAKNITWKHRKRLHRTPRCPVMRNHTKQKA